MSCTRLAIVTDVHHGQDSFTKKGTAALGLLEQFTDEVSGGAFDAVIDLGDRISDETPERDRELQRDVAQRFLKTRLPRHHLSGNHDRALLSQADNEAILDAPTGSRALQIGDVRAVFWQPDVTLTRDRGFHLADGDLDVLARLLNADERPTLLFSHVPLAGHVQIGNYYFEHNPAHATYAEIAAIRRVIAEAPCPIVALAGHVHWNTLTIVDGTPHITLQSLTESFTAGVAAGATTVLEIEDGTLRCAVRGHDPCTLVLPWRTQKPRWAAPLPPFRDCW